MGAGVRDYRPLISRKPPNGLLEWTLETYGTELDRFGLIYEVAYAKDYGLFQIPDEWARPRKTKMVRVICSCCGESTLLNWGKSETNGYGFILPDDEEGDWSRTVTSAGDEVPCPMCGEKVLVNKRAAVRGYYMTAEYRVISADTVEQSNELVLTCWTVQRRTYKAGYNSIEFSPAEAYVFTQTNCSQY